MQSPDPSKIRPRSGDWHISGWKAILLAPLVLLLAPIAAFASKRKKRTPAEVAGFIRDFIESNGGEWDWDDFTSVKLADPKLETIRLEADLVDLPVTEAGREQLKALLVRAEALKTDWLNDGQPE
jgi:hypothetical protein